MKIINVLLQFIDFYEAYTHLHLPRSPTTIDWF